MAEVSPDSDEYVLELMTQCELKLRTLHEKVQGKDLTALMKEMEEEEVSGSSINTPPASQWVEVQVWVLDRLCRGSPCKLSTFSDSNTFRHQAFIRESNRSLGTRVQ